MTPHFIITGRKYYWARQFSLVYPTYGAFVDALIHDTRAAAERRLSELTTLAESIRRPPYPMNRTERVKNAGLDEYTLELEFLRIKEIDVW